MTKTLADCPSHITFLKLSCISSGYPYGVRFIQISQSMSFERDVLLAFPPWKEFMEKKRKKEKNDEQVPLWKRELLKRIQTKNQRMSEDQDDIVEEHISKVSDNIFLVQEKKHHPRYRSAPHTKAPASELSSPSPPVILSVDNVIIIEKEDKNASNDMMSNSTGSIDSVFASEEVKEYPRAGIVHRLLGKFQFQTEQNKSDTKKHKNVHPPPYQRSKSADLLKPDSVSIRSASLVESSLVIEESTTDSSVSSESHPRTTSVLPDLITPLLLASAKPFTRQNLSSSDHGYHHVNMPIRKVSSPTSPKYTSPVKSISAEVIIAPPETDKIVLKPESPKKNETRNTFSFTDELSNLHSNKDVPIAHARSTNIVKITPQAKSDNTTKLVKHNDFKNGDTLHSSGSNSQPLPNNVKSIESVKLQDKSNFKESERQVVQKDDSSENKNPIEIRNNKGEKIIIMKENRSHVSSKKQDKSDIGFRKEINKNFNEPIIGKNQAPVVPKRITPKPRQTEVLVNGVDNDERKVNLTSSERPKVNPDSRDLKNVKNFNSDKKSVVEKRSSDLPCTNIDAMLGEPVIITPVTSLPLSPTETKKVVLPEKKAVSITPKVPSSTVKIEPVTPKKNVEPKNNFVNRTSAKTISVSPTKTEPTQKSSIFGPKVTKSAAPKNRGKSFTIDPRKFKRSATQMNTAGHESTREASSTRTIVPSSRSADGDIIGETPKTGKRKLTVDQITVIGGYVSLERSCLSKSKRKKGATLKFREDLETNHTYVSERSLLAADKTVIDKKITESPGFGKDSTIGKYTPKYLLSMKSEILEDEDDTSETISTTSDNNVNSSNNNSPVDATPLADESATTWSDTTSGSTDILF